MIKLLFEGEPVAASRPRVTRRGWTYNAPKYEAYKSQAQLDAQRQYLGKPLKGALFVKVVFYRSVQKSVSKAERKRRLSNEHRPIFKPDIDNLFKAVTDACTGIVWHDDNQIVSVEMEKMYAEVPRVEMEVQEL